MNEFIAKEKKKIGSRAVSLRELLHLTQPDVAAAVGIAKNTLNKLEKGISFSDYSLITVAYFFGMDISEFMQFDRTPSEEELRQRLAKFHNKNEKVLKVLAQTPGLVALIKKTITQTHFFQKPQPVQAFAKFLKAEYGAEYSSSAISQSLANAVSSHLLERKKGNGRNFVYQLKKKSAKQLHP